MNLYEQISIIKKRPGNYIGMVTLNNIEKFIDGVLFSLEVNNLIDEFDKFFRKYFNWYVNYKLLKYNISKELKDNLAYNGGRGFGKLIELIEINNQKQIELFFDMFDEFYLSYKNNDNFQIIVDELKNGNFKQT